MNELFIILSAVALVFIMIVFLIVEKRTRVRIMNGRLYVSKRRKNGGLNPCDQAITEIEFIEISEGNGKDKDNKLFVEKDW